MAHPLLSLLASARIQANIPTDIALAPFFQPPVLLSPRLRASNLPHLIFPNSNFENHGVFSGTFVVIGAYAFMKYNRFEDLPVWKQAIQLAHGVYALTRNPYFAQSGDLRSQLRRAALSVSNNIAEGFERGTTSELISFIYIARGSAAEVRSMLRFIETAEGTADLKSQISNLVSLSEQCSRQLRAWADHLQNSSIKGQRHLNKDSRQVYEQEQNAQRFEKYLQELVARARKEPARDP